MARTKNRFNAVNTEPEEIVPVQESWRTALYARLSVELASRRSESIENQWELMRKFTAGKPEFAELFEYTDKGFSGTDFHRPAFESMIS